MIPMKVRFAKVEDVLFPEAEPETALQAFDIELVCVDRGTGSGRPSVAISMETPGGMVYGLTTARLLVSAARMILAKYPDLMEGE